MDIIFYLLLEKSTVAKALKAQKAINVGAHTKGKKKVRKNIRFRRPKTYKPPRCPKDRRFEIPKRNKYVLFKLNVLLSEGWTPSALSASL